MDFNLLNSLLKDFNPKSLLGEKAHLEIAPYRVSMKAKSSDPARQAAVLILLYPIQNKTHFTLIKRPTYDGTHSGQIAFPGGKWEESDNDLTETAVREANEETNIQFENISIISELTKIFIPPSNFEVTPVLAVSSTIPDYIPDKIEVEKILEVELSELLNSDNQLEKEMTFKNGITFSTPYFQLQNEIVWGATAMILNELKHYIHNESNT